MRQYRGHNMQIKDEFIREITFLRSEEEKSNRTATIRVSLRQSPGPDTFGFLLRARGYSGCSRLPHLKPQTIFSEQCQTWLALSRTSLALCLSPSLPLILSRSFSFSLSLSLFLCPLSPSLLSLPLTNNTRGLQRGRVREGTFFVTRTSGKSVLDTKSPRESPPSKEVKVCPIQLSLSNRLCLRGKEHHF